MKSLLPLLCVLLVVPSTFADDDKPVEADKPTVVSIFPDKNLEEVVRKSVFAKRDNDEPLTAKDVEKISTIEGKGKGIRDLRGLEKCLSLALLDLEDNDVADMDPIMGLKRLQSINLANNRIGDLTALAELDRIQYLDLSGNRISDLEPLEKLSNLRTLYLSNNKVKDLSSIAGLSKIWTLYVDANRIGAVDDLAKLKWLSSLDIRDNQVTDLSPLKSLRELKYLVIEGNQVKDLGPLVAMASEDAKSERRFSPFWKIYLAKNPLSDDSKAQVTKLVELGGRVFSEPIPQ